MYKFKSLKCLEHRVLDIRSHSGEFYFHCVWLKLASQSRIQHTNINLMSLFHDFNFLFFNNDFKLCTKRFWPQQPVLCLISWLREEHYITYQIQPMTTYPLTRFKDIWGVHLEIMTLSGGKWFFFNLHDQIVIFSPW